MPTMTCRFGVSHGKCLRNNVSKAFGYNKKYTPKTEVLEFKPPRSHPHKSNLINVSRAQKKFVVPSIWQEPQNSSAAG